MQARLMIGWVAQKIILLMSWRFGIVWASGCDTALSLDAPSTT